MMNLQQFVRSADAQKPHFLVIGNPVGHSLSPLMHNTAIAHYNRPEHYTAVELQRNELSKWASWLNKDELKGVNITLPYKVEMLDYVDVIDESARQIGAINTIVKEAHQLVGFNTDAYGFSQPLQAHKENLTGGRSIIFGTGGASKGIVYALRQLGLDEIILVSRNPQKNIANLQQADTQIVSYDAWPVFAEEACLIVNATPLGMEPRLASSPVKENEISYLSGKICYDIVYKPLQTLFLKQASQAGGQTIQGLEMLIHQGSRSFALWTGKPFPVEQVRNKLQFYFQDAH